VTPRTFVPPTRPQLHVYTGEGKGKTTACIGLALRALGAGMKVHFIQFDKGFDGQNEHYSERHILRDLTNLRLDPTGCERIQPDGHFRFGVTPEDRSEALRALALARGAIGKGEAGLVILDEILSAQLYHLISEQDVLDLVALWRQEPKCELVLSGRTKLDSILAQADLVTEMRKVKHYYDEGLLARRGIDF
jgi:cob(I)alamin adenosyltransferase